MPAASSLHPPTRRDQRRAILLVTALYLLWTTATYLLEGRIHTLLRPDATAARLLYAGVANLLIGLIGTIAVLRWLDQQSILARQNAGFRGLGSTMSSIGAGLVLGFVIYALQPSPVWQPVVLANGFAQVLVVSTAEVLVCWAAAGGLSYALLQRPFGGRAAFTGAAVLASVLFGGYHFAHSPPFNQPGMVVQLTAIGLGTSTFFLVSRNVYGTLAFHNMLGLYGVTQSLAGRGQLAPFEQLQPALFVTAGVTLLLLVLSDQFILRRR